MVLPNLHKIIYRAGPDASNLQRLFRNFPSGSVFPDGTSLSKSGDESITLISGDSVPAERVIEIMRTLHFVNAITNSTDEPSPLRALLDIAEAGGRIDVEKIGGHVKDVLTRYGLGKSFRLEWPEFASPMSFPIPLVKPSFIVDSDVVAVVKSAVVDSNGGIVLRNPERPERKEVIEKIGEIWAQEATRREGNLPPSRVLEYDYSVLTQTGNNPIDLRQWYANPLEEGQENSPWRGFRRLTQQQTSSIKERFGPLSEQLPSEQVRSIALRLELLVSASENSVFSKMYDHIVEGEELSRDTALSIESLGLGKAFYQGSSKPETNLGIQFEKGVVEVLLAGACWFRNGNDPFLGITNPER